MPLLFATTNTMLGNLPSVQIRKRPASVTTKWRSRGNCPLFFAQLSTFWMVSSKDNTYSQGQTNLNVHIVHTAYILQASPFPFPFHWPSQGKTADICKSPIITRSACVFSNRERERMNVKKCLFLHRRRRRTPTNYFPSHCVPSS